MDPSQRCDVCGEQASGHYFGALVCLPCKSFFIRCTKDGHPNFSNQCGGKCDVLRGGRVKCQHCRFQKCISAGMYRKEKPEAVEPAEGQLLCKVCGDIANGVHFGVTTCEGCKKFFRRGLKENRSYTCKGSMRCSINPRMRNNCRYCRYQKCLFEGMSREAIKMGRPKKGELMRKPLKKLGVKPMAKTYERPPMTASNRSSVSSEYEQEDISNPDDVFDHVTAQDHNMAAGHQQIPAHVHQQLQHHQPQHQQQQQPQQQQQQQAGFSLGSILHDCMTVQDWDQNSEMSDMDSLHSGGHGGQRSMVGHPVVITSSSGGSVSVGSLSEELKTAPSPHLRRTSPSLHPDVLNLQQQQIQFQGHQPQQQQQPQQPQQQQPQQQQHHHLQMMNHFHGELSDQMQQQQQQQQPARQVTPFQTSPVSIAPRDLKITASNNNIDIISGLDFPDDHDLPVNRPVKVENITGSQVPSSFADGEVVLEDMKNLQTLCKAEFHSFNMQTMPAASGAYSLTDQQRSASVPPVGNTVVPISQLEPSVSSQIVAINMTSESMIYTPQPHEQILVQDGIPHLIQHHSEHANPPAISKADSLGESQLDTQPPDLGRGHDDVVLTQQGHDPLQRNLDLSHTPLTLDGGHSQVTISRGSAFRPEHLPDDVTVVSHSQGNPSSLSTSGVFTSVSDPILLQQQHQQQQQQQERQQQQQQQQQQHYVADTSIAFTTTSPLTTSREAGPSGSHTPLSAVSESPAHYQKSTSHANPPSLAPPAPVTPTSSVSPPAAVQQQPSTPSGRSSILAILQQHREAIQAGRTVQLSPEEIEELFNTVNAEQARAQKLIDTTQVSPKGQRSISAQHIADLRRQQKTFQVNRDSDESPGFSRLTPPAVASVPQHQYQPPSPVVQTSGLRPQSRQLYSNQSSPASESSVELRQPQRPHSSAGLVPMTMANNFATDSNNLVNNNNSHNNNNSINSSMNINAIQRRLYSPSPGQIPQQVSTPHQQATIVAAPAGQSPCGLFDDSFNSNIIRDSTLLHEINRVFLGIDNSCDAYGCHRRADSEDEGQEGRIDDRTVLTSMSPDAFTPEVSHRYWHGFRPFRGVVSMTPERQKIILDVLEAFDNLQKTYVTNEPEYGTKKSQNDQLEHWHHIQRRIARHVVAGQRFCRNIPGYFKLDIQDRICLGKHVGFGLMVLIACTEFYDPEFKRFKYIWNWTMPMQNPLFSYKVHLLSLGDRIHDITVDRTEAAMLCAISMTSIDCPGLIKPDIVCVVRDALVDALGAHIAAKSENPHRLRKLLSLMPQVRLMTLWYNNLMKKMSLPSDMVNNKMSMPRQREAVGAENTLNVS